MKMKTAELTGVALDWAVAKCEGLAMGQIAIDGVQQGFFNPSTDWAHGGPIMEREGIDCVFHPGISDMPSGATTNKWTAMHVDYNNEYEASSLLVAVMRRYVAMKLGDEIEVPEEIML
jgi:hypothetical protein